MQYYSTISMARLPSTRQLPLPGPTVNRYRTVLAPHGVAPVTITLTEAESASPIRSVPGNASGSPMRAYTIECLGHPGLPSLIRACCSSGSASGRNLPGHIPGA